jgi:hypothetical protein
MFENRIRHTACRLAALLCAASLASGCKPAEPVNFTKTQHDSLDKAKALEAQMGAQADAQKQRIDDAAK